MKIVIPFLNIVALTVLCQCEKPTQACFTYSPDSIDTSTLVTFDASCSDNSMYYTWTFGDGTPDTSITSGPMVTHQYLSPGTYTVTLNTSRKDGFAIGISRPVASKDLLVQ